MLDAGTVTPRLYRAIVEVADLALMVIRPCYLALRRAVGDPRLAGRRGRSWSTSPVGSSTADDVAAVLGLPVLGQFPVRPEIARAVDAGVLRDRLPAALAAPGRRLLDGLADRAGGRWAA